MKVLALTDVHKSVAWLRKALEFAIGNGIDTVTISGDFQEAKPIELLANFKGRVFAVPGNMDGTEELEALEEAGLSIHGKVVKYEGYTFIGLGALNFKSTLENVSKALSSGRLSNLVLVSHFPPKDSKVDKAFNLMHVGSGSIRSFIETYRPLLCLCGHIHEARGLDRLGNTLIVNPGPLFRGFMAIVDLKEVKVELLEARS